MTGRGVRLAARISRTGGSSPFHVPIEAGVVPMARERTGLRSEMLPALVPGDTNAPAQRRPSAKSSSTALAGNVDDNQVSTSKSVSVIVLYNPHDRGVLRIRHGEDLTHGVLS